MLWLTQGKQPKLLYIQAQQSVPYIRLFLTTIAHGIEAIETPGKGGRRRGYLSLAQEKKFLTQFMDSALTGLITNVTKIKQAYEAKIGQKVHQSTIYRLLERHEWRKVMPRSHHPGANFEEHRIV